MTFTELPPALSAALVERGYAEPTPVQAAVLEPGAIGRDLVVSAQTGSGKTVAFGMAIAHELLSEDGLLPVAQKPLALAIAPTRELALQVSRELSWLYQKAGGRIATCVGGMNASEERRALSRGAHIVVGTPGRLCDHLARGALDLSALRAIVLDEADEMLDMGFREDLEQILDAAPESRRTLLFSATMPRPIEALAKRYQRNALRISTVGDDRGHGDIAYQALTVSPSEIEHAVVNLLRFHEAETAMLFCATRDNVRHLHATLQERGFAVVALSGEHSQSERNQALQALRDRRARVCVATDVASRGIDLPSLSLVIHVEIPRDAETLQHRSGRTGRAGKKGTAVLIVPYPRRRRVEMMLKGAKINAQWIDVPTAEAIRANDRERLIAAMLAPVDYDEEDRALAQRLLAERSPEDIAAALVRAHRAMMPEPEELIANTPEAQQARQAERHRPGFEDMVWFRMDVGRRQNADARWILPLLCRRGHITRTEIGAIRIAANETWFQVQTAVAAKFSAAAARTALSENPEDSIRIEQSQSGPREEARENRRSQGGDQHGGQHGGGHRSDARERRPAATPRPAVHRDSPERPVQAEAAAPTAPDQPRPRLSRADPGSAPYDSAKRPGAKGLAGKAYGPKRFTKGGAGGKGAYPGPGKGPRAR